MEDAREASTSATTLESYRLKLPTGLAQQSPECTDDDLEACLVEKPIAGNDGFFYIPDFITEDEERYLIEKVRASTPFRFLFQKKGLTHVLYAYLRRSMQLRFPNGRLWRQEGQSRA